MNPRGVSTFNKIAQLFVFSLLILIGAITINLLPAIYDLLVDFFVLDSPAEIMLEEAFFILLAATLALIWGYLIDKVNRKRTLQVSLIFLVVGYGFSIASRDFSYFVAGRMITAVGYGALMPVIYSIVSDYIPAKFWSTTFGFFAFLTALGNLLGNFLSGFITPLNIWNLGWQFSFLILGVSTLILGVILSFFRIPQRGASSFEIINPQMGQGLRDGQLAYTFTINRKDLRSLWKIKTNRRIIILSFFAVIPGAIMSSFLVYYLATYPFMSFPSLIRIQVAQIFGAAVGIGYDLGTIILGPFFDYLHSRSPRKRANYTYKGLIIAIPLFIFAFLCITPVDFTGLNLSEQIDGQNPLNPVMYYTILNAVLFYHPIYVFYYVSLFFGSFFVAPITINRTPTLLEVNLPEHMGTTQALLNFSDQYGKGFTLIFLAFQYIIFEVLFEVVNGKLLLLMSVLWYLVPLYLWRRIEPNIVPDIMKKNRIIKERSSEVRFPGEILNIR